MWWHFAELLSWVRIAIRHTKIEERALLAHPFVRQCHPKVLLHACSIFPQDERRNITKLFQIIDPAGLLGRKWRHMAIGKVSPMPREKTLFRYKMFETTTPSYFPNDRRIFRGMLSRLSTWGKQCLFSGEKKGLEEEEEELAWMTMLTRAGKEGKRGWSPPSLSSSSSSSSSPSFRNLILQSLSEGPPTNKDKGQNVI